MMSSSVQRRPETSPDLAALAGQVEGPLRELLTRAQTSERSLEAACGEIRHVLAGLPYETAKTGKYRALRRRLERFLSDRLDGL